MLNKKGFTLIELLAVIAILAVVSLITAPIIVNTINKSRDSSNKVSGTNYIRAVDTALKTENLDNIYVEDGYYQISKDGDICLNELRNGNCIGKKIKIKANGNMPIKGNVTIEDDEVARATVVYEEFSLELNYDGQVEYKPFTLEYDIGQPIHVVGEGETANDGTLWYVIGEDSDRITLLFSKAIISSPWITSADYSIYSKVYSYCRSGNCSYIGPVTALTRVNSFVSSIDIPEIDNYEYINNMDSNNEHQYQKLTINKGILTLTDYAGNKIVIRGKTIARIMSAEEILKIASMYNLNLTYDNLKEYLNTRLDDLNAIFSSHIGNKESLEEIFESLGMEDNWINAYFFTSVLNQDLTNPEVLKFIMPGWLSEQETYVHTSTSTSMINGSNAESYIFKTMGMALADGTKVTAILPDDSSFDDTSYIQPVIQIKKDDKRIQK